MKWLAAFFSQTGSEILNICDETGIEPTVIITNRLRRDGTVKNIRKINPRLIERFGDRIIFLPVKPSVDDYRRVLSSRERGLISLHGYLRIIPAEICNEFECINLHPGLICEPGLEWLKGADPQERAYCAGLDYSGSVIHKVVAEVDAGEILDSIKTPIKGMSLDETYEALHKDSTKLWVKFFSERILNV